MKCLLGSLFGRKSWSRGRCCALALLALCIYVAVFQRQNFYGEPKETAIGWDLDREPEPVRGAGPDTVFRQIFYAQDGILDYIYVALGGHGQTGSLVASVYDGAGTPVAERVLPCSQLVESGAQGIYFHIRVTPGEEYSYTLSFRDIEDGCPEIQTAHRTGGEELGTLYVDGQPQEACVYGLFVYRAYYTQNVLWRLCAAGMLLAFLLWLFYPWISVRETRLLPVLLPVHAVLGVFLLELAAGTDLTGLTAGRIFYNSLFSFALFAILAVFLWNGTALLRTGTVLCLALGVAEYYVLEFRGTPLVPSDLLSIGTAAEVTGSYQFDLPASMVTAVLLLLLVFLAEGKLRFRRYTLGQRGLFLAYILLLGAAGFACLRSSQVLSTGNNGGFFWNLESSYQKYGYFLSTYIYEHYQTIEKPEGYSEEKVRELAEEAETAREGGSCPNIIAVMNESFTDFASVGGVGTVSPVTPFFDSLKEDTVRGNLYVSVFGGGTASTEFEFLTGSTMGFLPQGSVAYQAYIKEELPSLASYLQNYGYFTLVCHFADRSNWNRNQVYPLLGFQEYVSEEDVGELECIHGYPSDEENYREVIRRYEEWKEQGEGEHFFCFNITIQNHGGYTSGYRCEDAPRLSNGQSWEDVEEYLSLMRQSDRAFEDLVEYFREEEAPTVILMFGDHWPRLNSSFISSMADQAGDCGELEKNQNKYVTPFVIWANYDIEEREIERLSANYLGTLLLETAGLPLNGYQTFLRGLSGELPVVNALGYVDGEGNYYSSGEALPDACAGAAEEYQILQYANLFGKPEGTEGFFG